MKKEMDEDAFEPSLKRMSKIWMDRNETTNTLKVSVTSYAEAGKLGNCLRNDQKSSAKGKRCQKRI